jgi:hypothetical protein
MVAGVVLVGWSSVEIGFRAELQLLFAAAGVRVRRPWSGRRGLRPRGPWTFSLRRRRHGPGGRGSDDATGDHHLARRTHRESHLLRVVVRTDAELREEIVRDVFELAQSSMWRPT